jgi:penicillin-insensitive murein endopeptidase
MANAESPWSRFRTPVPGQAVAVGAYNNGCLLGGVEIAPEGTGYQVIRLARNRHFAHPLLADYLSDLGKAAAEHRLGTLLVADIAMPRGGPFVTGHRSHQTGLDADIWLRLDVPYLPRHRRTKDDQVKAHSVVDTASFSVLPDRWNADLANLIRIAASDKRVARIFVHPAIKQVLCEQEWPDRTWLRRVRPWHGHTAHFHVRLHCPENESACVTQQPPPDGDGCGNELASWLPPNYRPPRPSFSSIKPQLPVRCKDLLEQKD